MNSFLSSFSGPLNGPAVVPPTVNQALICLHGFGSSGDDLIALAPTLQATLGNLGESLAVYAPHGPSHCLGNDGYQWFRDMGWTFRDPEGLARVIPQLDSLIAQIMDTHGIPASRIALLGFSQGAMTLLHALPSLTHQPAGLISCCGTISVAPSFPSVGVQAKPPILFVHGHEDDVLPADASVQAASIYSQQGYATQVEILPNLGHGINAAALAHISVFLQTLWQTE